MRVIFVNRFFYPDHSATSQLLSDLAFELKRKGASITVITSRESYDDSEVVFPSYESVDGVEVVRVWTSGFGRQNLVGRSLDYLTFYLAAFVNLLLKIEKGDIVVAKTDPPLISVIAEWVCWIKDARLVNWIQDLFPEVAIGLGFGLFDGRLGKLVIRIRNSSLRYACLNVVLGKKMREAIIDQGVEKSRIKIISNWSDDKNVFPVEASDNPLRAEWSFSGRFVVGYSGNMGRAHDFSLVLDAAEALKSMEDIVFVFIGDGAKREWIEEQIKGRSLSNVVMKPYQPRELLSNSLSLPDVHYVSLRPEMEGLIVPSKIYGVLAVGRPMIFSGSQDGEIANMIRDNDCGLAVGFDGDVSEMVAAIRKLADNPEICRKMGANARALFDHSFGMKSSLRSWCKALESV